MARRNCFGDLAGASLGRRGLGKQKIRRAAAIAEFALDDVRVIGFAQRLIDFAVNPNGEILFFEANATMVVYPPLLDPKWAYRRPVVETVLSAVHTMLMEQTVANSAAQI